MLERMDEFFAARVDEYEHHMLNMVEGCREGYGLMASRVPISTRKLLDLGCGTGLELAEIFVKLPELMVTGIDLSQIMLDRLRDNYQDKKLDLICGDYFACDFGTETYDAAVSFQTLHHYSHEKKLGLYRKICRSLKLKKPYIECDCMVMNQEDEDYYFAENARLRKELVIGEQELYHCDTPCTVDNQIRLLYQAGFREVELVWRKENTTLLQARK